MLTVFAATICFAESARAQSSQLRVASYNIEADVSGVTTPRDGLYQVLEGIGEENIGGDVQPLDILALQETTSNSTTVAPIVSNLNSFYGGTAVYAQSPVQGGQHGSANVGNGPNALVYNTTTLQLLNSVGVGTPGGIANGEYRQVMRYEFEPVGGTAASIFYVYVTHSKSSVDDTGAALFADENSRSEEAAIIRADEGALATAGNPNPRVLYMGDFNLSGSALVSNSGQSVSAYQTITAPGQGHAVDPFNTGPQNNNETWDDNAAFKSLFSETAKNLQYRDDLQLMTENVFDGTQALGLEYIPGTEHVFGNNGSVGVNGNASSASNTALNDLEPNPPISAATLLADLTTASDHLPVVADYTFAPAVSVPEPDSRALAGMGVLALLIFSSAHHFFIRNSRVATQGLTDEG
jgi:endonuclease/exonuclease/phosphatase family metal-dependent hydrolase